MAELRWCNSQRPFPAYPFDPKNYDLKQWFQILNLHQSPVSLCKMAAKAPAWRCWFKLTRGRTLNICFKKPLSSNTAVQKTKRGSLSTLREHREPLGPVRICKLSRCKVPRYFRKQLPLVGITFSRGAALHPENTRGNRATLLNHRAAGKSIRRLWSLRHVPWSGAFAFRHSLFPRWHRVT